MKSRGFCHLAALLLLMIGWAIQITTAHRQTRVRGGMATTSPENDDRNNQLCSAVLEMQQRSSTCSGGNCREAINTDTTTVAPNSSDSSNTEPSSPGLGNIVAMMDDGIRIMDSATGTENRTFILGMTGAGKSTLTLLLTAFPTLYSCKRAVTNLDYVIRDLNQIISTTDSQSKTKVPEIINAPDLGTSFYDCPGFSDTESAEELTNAYFIKHGLDNSKRAKIILVAPFDAVKSPGDRRYFATLLEHTVKTIKNVEKYRNSFSLAVTQCGRLTPEEIVNDVAGFLKSLLNEELPTRFQGQEGIFNSTKILLNSLLVPDPKNGKFIAIGAFRSPTQHGRLTDLLTAREDREELVKVLESTFYTDSHPTDFGYSISDGGMLRVEELESLIGEKIRQDMDTFWAEIQVRYARELYQLALDQHEHKKKAQDALQVFRAVRQQFLPNRQHDEHNIGGPKQFVVSLMSSMASLKLDLPNNPILSSILLKESHVKFVDNLLGRSAVRPEWSNWLNGLEQVIKCLEIHASWAKTLIELEQILETHQVQQTGYSFPKLRNESGRIDVTTENIHVFNSSSTVPQELHHIKAALVPFIPDDSGSGDGDVVSTAINFGQLNPILEHFANNRLSCTLNETVATIQGNFILASKLVASNNNNNCINAVTKKVVIYAWDTFFLDAPINAKSITGEDTFDLVIIANRLNSFGYPIQLNGRDAANHEMPAAAAENPGADGSVGSKGGDFVGLFGQISGQLAVESNGGKGGDGQGGGDGHDGMDGTILDRNFAEHVQMTRIGTRFQNYPSRCRIDSVPEGIQYEVEYGSAEKRCHGRIYGVHSRYHYHFHGNFSQRGGNGGNGGHAGQAGQPGVGKIYELSQRNLRSSATDGNCGPQGLPGAGGKGGSGGQHTYSYICVFYGEESNYECKLTNAGWYRKTAPVGVAGVDGGLPPPCTRQRVFSPQAYAPDIINYKTAARAQLRSSTAKRRLLPFLVNMEENQGVSSEFFTAKSFITDLVALENQLPSLLKQSHTELSLLYRAVFNRTAEMLRSSQSEQDRTILRYAASAVYGRLVMLSQTESAQSSNHIITNLERYLDITAQILQNLQRIESDSNAAKRITVTKDKFLQFMQSRMDEVDGLTQKVILPEISKIQDHLTKGMESILRKLLEERQTAITTLNETQAYMKQLEDTMTLRKIFDALKIGAQCVSFLGPKGAVVGAAISAATSVAEAVMIHDNPGPESTPLASKQQDKALRWYLESQKQKLEDQKLQFANVKATLEGTLAAADPGAWSQDFQSSKQETSSALSLVDDFTKKLDQIGELDQLEDVFDVIESLGLTGKSIKMDVTKGLEDMEASLQQQEEEYDQGKMKLLGDIRKGLAIVKSAANFYKLFKKNESMVEELARAENVLEGYDNKINTVTSRMPQILSQLEKLTTAAFKSARNQSSSRAALDISSWQLQSTLDDVDAEIESKILVGAPIDSRVKTSMAKLKEAFRTLFKICDRIQDYVTEQRMASFISDSLISTVEARPLKLDRELYRNLQHLKLVSQSNLVLRYWQNIESSFRMYVFPYADIYLSQISLLQGEQDPLLLPQNITDLPTLVTEISERLTTMKDQLATLSAIINPVLHTNEHVGRFNLMNPLYTWDAEEVKNVLPDLLNGTAINLMADIRKSPRSFDAIKFKEIHLYLVHEDSMLNSTLQSALSYFKLIMTHGGVNHYRFDRKYYGVYSEPLSLDISYQVPSLHKNQNYIKLGNGPSLLSPYTLWTFQLYANENRMTMDPLKVFLGQKISLVLTGLGNYVTNSAGQSAARRVDRFYKAVQL